jgi:hypothetical protein
MPFCGFSFFSAEFLLDIPATHPSRYWYAAAHRAALIVSLKNKMTSIQCPYLSGLAMQSKLEWASVAMCSKA